MEGNTAWLWLRAVKSHPVDVHIRLRRSTGWLGVGRACGSAGLGQRLLAFFFVVDLDQLLVDQRGLR
jgi:hypothetical protein